MATITVFLFVSLFGLNTSIYRQHYYVNDNKKWSEAQTYCKENYDDLSTASNEELQQLSQNPQITNDFFWIGLERDSQNLTRWIWTGGEDATDVIWDSGQPDSVDQKCGAFRVSTSKMHDVDCDWQMPFSCMKLSKLMVVQQEISWEEALVYCRHNYKHMAVLSSAENMTEARNQSTTALTDDVWIGLRFIAGHWFWVNGKAFIYKAWSSDGELQCPAMNQRCAVLNRSSMFWKPMDCEKKLNFFCLKP